MDTNDQRAGQLKSEKQRLKEIVSVFLKHGLKNGIANPVQVRLALEELGPTFIKIGQMLSMRPDIIPQAYIKEFQKLQDDVKPERYEVIREIIEHELKRPIEELFLSFAEEPIACASLAVVHPAVLKNGDRVVVKIQRPGARETMLKDIDLLRRITRFIKYAPQAEVLDLDEAAGELWRAANKELDFQQEARNIKKFYEYNRDVAYITCPRVFEEYTTREVLVMERVEGIPIAHLEQLAAEGYDLRDVAVKLADNYLKQIFEDGFFHADPHPGNILVREGKIVYLDFGMMGVLDKSLLEKFNSLIYGIATGNVEAMQKDVLRIGIKKGSIDTRKLYSDIEQIYNNYIVTSLHEIDVPQMMEEIFKACRKNNIAIPADLVMMAKGLVTIEGLVARLAPEINIMDLALPYARRYILSKRNIKQDLTRQLENFYTLTKSGAKLPVRLLELINGALAGKIRVQMEHTNLDEALNKLNKMVNRLVFGLVLSSLVVGSSIVINANVGPKIYGISVFGLVGFLGAAVMGTWLLISILYSGKM